VIQWDPTISLGTVIAAIVVLIPIFKLIRDFNRVEFKVDLMWHWYLKNVERRSLSEGDEGE
jgi:hypothetical protein